MPVLKKLAEFVLAQADQTGAELSITFVDNEVMQGLNSQYRGIDTPTDVLSFNLQDNLNDHVLGEVIIATAVARSQADELGVDFAEEIKLLLLHGILHLLGFLHDTPAAALLMEQRQTQLLDSFSGLRRKR